MAKYFTISELTRSSEAIKRGIDNTPPPDVKVKLISLINNLLDPIREKWGAPITVNSGFRCQRLNDAVKGAKTSQHMRGEAADISAGSPAKNKELFNLILKSKLPFDQLIDEKSYRWVHVSHSTKNRSHVLHLP